eukprot:242262-Pyramimonas_sp.AAC.1
MLGPPPAELMGLELLSSSPEKSGFDARKTKHQCGIVHSHTIARTRIEGVEALTQGCPSLAPSPRGLLASIS